jgi:uncharacterized protein (TIGR02266 family)
MSDPVTLARTARESLARGLNALQADPNVPQHLVELAAPIAQAMGALHQIERSGGAQVAPHAQNALANVQGALAQLQSAPPQHAAVAAAMEAVAGALGSVHALSRSAPVAPPPVAAPPQPPAALQQQPAYAPQAQAFPQQQYAQPAPQPPQYAPQPQYAQAPAAQPAQAHPRTAPVPQQQPAAAGVEPARPGAGDAIPAELGAHSPSNFYKGLSGNDIVDHGGLFVSTYKLPKLGTRVRLRVSLPGGYEFEANAVVRWRREPSDASTDAPPGFGAQFTDITPEARQLVYRYVRNREPMFHDDL